MVGNDVVDLDDPETAAGGLNPRFDTRVFTDDERRRIALGEDAGLLRWSFWAAKESAYKLRKRNNSRTVFAHSRFETVLDDGGFGTVRHGDWTCAVAVNRRESAIHAVATVDSEDRARVVSGVTKISRERDPGLEVRRLAIDSVARTIGVKRESLTITTGPDRIPLINFGGAPQGFLSLSHHGSLVAFAWMPPE